MSRVIVYIAFLLVAISLSTYSSASDKLVECKEPVMGSIGGFDPNLDR